MLKNLDKSDAKEGFTKDLHQTTLKNLLMISGLGMVILLYYTYGDWAVRHSMHAIYTRVIPLTLLIVIFTTHLFFKHKFNYLKIILYTLLYVALQLMAYGKCLIHMHDDGLIPSVTGAIIILFVISLDIKNNTLTTAFIYGIPLLIYTLLLIIVIKPSSEEFIVLADIYPIAILGFSINRIRHKLRLKLFTTNNLLSIEQQKTKALYKETLINNEDLKEKAQNANLHKEEMQEKNEALKKSNETKDRFLAIIAHDLKNPFHIILGYSDLLSTKYDQLETKEKKNYINNINISVLGANKLLTNLLTWAQSQGDSIPFEPNYINACLLIDESINELKQQFKNKLITVSNNVAVNVTIYADQNMIETVLRNLLSNAIKFTHKGGSIAIDAKQFFQESNKHIVKLTVSDTGMGMTPEVQSRIFNISDNYSTKGTEDESGTGLGLLLCKEFIERHKGEIWVKSEDNNGSRFSFTLPSPEDPVV